MSTTPPPFNDQKQHYESLLSFFKNCMYVAGVLIAIATYLNYSNGKEMKDEMKDEMKERKAEMKDRFDEMKLRISEMNNEVKEQKQELYSKQSSMENSVDKFLVSSKDEITYSRSELQNQLANIQLVAKVASNNKIEEIFKANNFDAYIGSIAKEKMKPIVDSLIADKMNHINDSLNKRFNAAIDGLFSSNRIKVTTSMAFIQANSDIHPNDAQINKLIQALVVSNERINQGVICTILENENRKIVYDFYIDNLKHKGKLMELASFLNYVMNPYWKYNIEDYKTMMDSVGSPEYNYAMLVGTASKINIPLTIDLLNSKYIIDKLYNKPVYYNKFYQNQDEERVSSYLGTFAETDNYKNSYVAEKFKKIKIEGEKNHDK